MRWFTVQGSLRDHAKWLDLDPVARGGWITLMLIAHSQEPRWRLGQRPTVEKLLRREGFDAPGAVIDALLQVALVDDRDGELWVHDADQWQRKPSDDPEATRERQRRSRATRKADDASHAVSRPVTPTDRQTDSTNRQNAHTRAKGSGYDSLIVEDGS